MCKAVVRFALMLMHAPQSFASQVAVSKKKGVAEAQLIAMLDFAMGQGVAFFIHSS